MPNDRDVSVLKADGSREYWKPEKLRHSLRRSGAKPRNVDLVVEQIERELTDGVATSEIYRKAFTILKTLERPVAARYSLRRALLDLGPSGFPFEDFLAEIFKTKGYHVTTRNILRGKCVEHEVDLAAHTTDRCFIAEAKFHNALGLKSDLQTVLYSQARFEDLKGLKVYQNAPCGISEVWVITNTKFSARAIEYANCIGMTLVSWGYPEKGNLQDLIEEAELQPVTALTTLSRGEKIALMQHGTALCKNVIENREVLTAAGIKPNKIGAVIEESRQLCYPV